MAVLGLTLGGCAATGGQAEQDSLRAALLARSGQGEVSGDATSASARDTRELGSLVRESDTSPVLLRGTDRMVAQPRVRAGVTVTGSAVSLQFEQAPIVDVIHAVFGDILGLPYVVTESVTGTVTIRTATALERNQVLPVMESLLAANGMAAVQDDSGVFHIGTAEAVRDVAPALTLPGAKIAGQRVVVVPLQYIGASEMAQVLAPVAKPESFVRVDGFRNLLLMAGTSTQLEGWLEIVRLFDVDVLKGMSVGIFPLQNLSVKEVEAALSLLMSEASASGSSVLGGSGAAGGTSASQSRSAPAPASANRSAAGTEDGIGTPMSIGGPLGGVVRFMGIERMNAILVVTSRAHYLEEMRRWIEHFDVRRDNPVEPRLYVYPVQNGTASHLASLLSAVFGGGTTGSMGTPVTSGVAPGLASTASSSSSGAMSVPDATSTGVAATAVSSVELAPNVRVVADEHNNAILIYASGHEFKKIEAALRDLDKAPTQVLIEASIIEVTLNDTLKYGLQWYFHGGLGSRYSGEGELNPNLSGDIRASQPGFSYSITSPAGDVRAVLNALADKSLLKVISSPSVMVLDNQTAKIHVGDQQPVRSATTITDAGRETISIEYKDTGVQLSVTPSVNAGGMVSMDVSQVVTDVGGVDSATLQRSFLQRFVSTKVAVRSGETVVLGGLIRDNDRNGRQGIPILHDVPVLGNLFGATDNSRVRTELLVTLTPRVLETEADLRGIGLELRSKMGQAGLLFNQSEIR